MQAPDFQSTGHTEGSRRPGARASSAVNQFFLKRHLPRTASLELPISKREPSPNSPYLLSPWGCSSLHICSLLCLVCIFSAPTGG